MNKAEKSLRWVVNQIPDFKPTTNEEKMLVAIKLYSEAGAEEIKRLEVENAALCERLEKAVELPRVECIMTREWLSRELIGDIMFEWCVLYKKDSYLMAEPCLSKGAAEIRLAELKGGKHE